MMIALNSYFFCFGLVFGVFKGVFLQEERPVTQSCLECICQTRSECISTCQSEEKGPCGPFLITDLYWQDANKPTIEGEGPVNGTAFSNCVQDIDCAYKTVQGYMSKYQKDCNGDNKIDCDDFVKMHILGAFGCTQPMDPFHSNTYQECKDNIIKTRTNTV